jgi:hypothetical protein
MGFPPDRSRPVAENVKFVVSVVSGPRFNTTVNPSGRKVALEAAPSMPLMVY